MPKNVQTTIQLHSFHMLAKLCSKNQGTRLQQYSTSQEFPDVQAGFRKGRGTRGQTANICWIMEKAKKVRKNIYICFINYTKAFDYVDLNKLMRIFKKIEIQTTLTVLRNLNAGQEAKVRIGHGATGWFQIGKGVQQHSILSLCLFNLSAGYIRQKPGLD